MGLNSLTFSHSAMNPLMWAILIPQTANNRSLGQDIFVSGHILTQISC